LGQGGLTNRPDIKPSLGRRKKQGVERVFSGSDIKRTYDTGGGGRGGRSIKREGGKKKISYKKTGDPIPSRAKAGS